MCFPATCTIEIDLCIVQGSVPRSQYAYTISSSKVANENEPKVIASYLNIQTSFQSTKDLSLLSG